MKQKLQAPDWVVIGLAAATVGYFLLKSEPSEVTYHQNADGEVVATTVEGDVVVEQKNLGHKSGVRIYTDANGRTLCAIGDEPCKITPEPLRSMALGL